ncbi:unnamed protein product [Pylaiella littoralis]
MILSVILSWPAFRNRIRSCTRNEDTQKSHHIKNQRSPQLGNPAASHRAQTASSFSDTSGTSTNGSAAGGGPSHDSSENTISIKQAREGGVISEARPHDAAGLKAAALTAEAATVGPAAAAAVAASSVVATSERESRSGGGAVDGDDEGERSGGHSGEAKQLLELAKESMERHGQHADRRGADHLALVPEALECLKTILPLMNDKDIHNKEMLLSVFQLCEETVLAASDDCSEDDASSSRTLRMAKATVEAMLSHPRLDEVRTANCKERLDRYISEIDHLLQVLTKSRRPANSGSGSDRNDEGDARNDEDEKPALRPSGWSEDIRAAAVKFCEELYMSLQPQTSDFERVDAVRKYAEKALRERFSEGRVSVFGSSAMQLSVPDSDIDLTIHLPSRAKLVQELKDNVESARNAVTAAEEDFPVAVKLLHQRVSMDAELQRLEGRVRGKKVDLEDMTRSKSRIAKRLKGLGAFQAERRRKDGAPAEATRAADIPNGGTASMSPPTPAEHQPPATRGAPLDGGSATMSGKAEGGGIESVPGGRTGSVPAPDVKTNSTADGDAGMAAPAPEGQFSGSSGDAGGSDSQEGGKLQTGYEPNGEKQKREDGQAKREDKDRAEAAILNGRLRHSEERIQETTKSIAQMQGALEKKRKAFAEWKAENFGSPPEEQKKAVDAVHKSRLSLEKSEQRLKATSKIVFEMKRVLERKGFTDVMAVHRSRVPVVKTCAPVFFWGRTGRPCLVDISVNNLVAVHNTRLVKAYTDLDPRCRRLLYLVKTWSKARGVNDSSKGTLSSYAHCVTVLHYLTRVGVIPSLLKEHPSLSKGGDGHESSPAVPDAAGNDILIEGIDVSFSQPTDPGLPQPHPLPPITPGVATPAADPTSTQSVPEEGKKEEQEKGTTESHPRGASENTSSNVGEDTLAARDAEVCDLLLGYFRYCAEEFCHSKQVMSLRPKSILNKADVWSRPKMWRTSVEDPFLTFDSTNPHDLGWVLTRPGQKLLREEWKRGHTLMQRGAVGELLAPSDMVRNPKNVPGNRRAGRGGGIGGGGGGGGGNNAPNKSGQGRGGKLWTSADGTGRGHLQRGGAPGHGAMAGMKHRRAQQELRQSPAHPFNGAQQQPPPQQQQQQQHQHQHQRLEQNWRQHPQHPQHQQHQQRVQYQHQQQYQRPQQHQQQYQRPQQHHLQHQQLQQQQQHQQQQHRQQQRHSNIHLTTSPQAGGLWGAS